ncbi:MAG: EAL domain-containing protein [Nitrosomonadales bacterium]|nr:EAL domain-containing protein [Nitrosomonadales bacterium]
MTLLRQLIIVIATLFTLLFAGSVAINIHNTRTYLNEQLRSISQDTATSLGLSLSPHMEKGEMAIVESMINATADGGYYSEVAITDVSGKAVFERKQPVVIKGVPAWFVNWVSLETPRGEAMVMAGWKQAGKIHVSANPGYAYATLWSNSVGACWWFLGFSGFALLLGVAILRQVLLPLRAVEAQAKAICDREYPIQDRMPWTTELRNVVSAMNLMAAKVREMFKEQADAMERARADAYADAATGLANRKYFDLHLNQMTKERKLSSVTANALLLIELEGFKSFNERKGYQAGDELLRGCGELIEKACKEAPNLQYFTARLSGANFVVVAQNIVEKDALALAEKLASSFDRLLEKGLTDAVNVGHIGVAIHHEQTAGQLLSEAHMALRMAQVKGPNSVHMNDSKTVSEFGAYAEQDWLEILGGLQQDNRIVLYRQPCLSCKDDAQILQHETLLRVRGKDGKLIPANVVIPMAKHLHLTLEIDKSVVSETLARLGRPENAHAVMAVNLFPMSIQDSGFVSWLGDILRKHASVAPRIAFELIEYGATDNLDALRGWVEQVARTGAKTGLDQVGRGFKSFGYLDKLKLDYIKIDGGYTRDIHKDKDNQFFVDSLVKLAHGHNIYVIAESVETRDEWNMLKSLRVDGVKGYGVGQPEKWD